MSRGKIAIIPARGGSKRIPRKNIKEFLGRPIIAYSIEVALASRLFDEVMVSTDDEEIAGIALEFGAHVPFMRSRENSCDCATSVDVLEEVINNYRVKCSRQFELGCCIYPTAPFIKIEHLRQGYRLMEQNGLKSVFPVVGFSYPIWRGLEMADDGGLVKMVWPEYIKTRSQDLKKVFHDAGQWYWFNCDVLLAEKQIFTDRTGSIVLEETAVQDIDSPLDWTLAELKYRLNAEKEEGDS